MLRITIPSVLLALTAVGCGQPQANSPSPVNNNPTTKVDPSPSTNPVTRAGFRSLPVLNHAAALKSAQTGARPNVIVATPSVHLPQIGDHALFSTSGNAAVQAGSTPGSATYTGAVVLDPNMQQPPATLGTGAYDVTAGGTQFTNANAETIAYTAVDPSNNVEYLVLGAWSSVVDPATQIEIADVVYVVVPSSDFAAGTSVALDGNDRIAIFFHGDTSLPDPELAAAALTGTVTFSAGSIAVGGTVDATLAGDFEDIQIQPSNPNPNPSPSPSPSPGGGSISAGTYNLHYDATASVECEGTLAGQDASFAALLPADLGLSDGVVTLSLPSAGVVEVAGLTGFGPTAIQLGTDPQAPPGLYLYQTNGSGTGPVSTDQVGTAFMLDGDSASATLIGGGAAYAYLTADQQGFCQVAFSATLTP